MSFARRGVIQQMKKKGPNNENHIHWRSPGGYVVQPKDSRMLIYRTDRLEEQGVYKDVFDGQVYKDLKKDGQFEGELE